jgi:hypothetical protein
MKLLIPKEMMEEQNVVGSKEEMKIETEFERALAMDYIFPPCLGFGVFPLEATTNVCSKYYLSHVTAFLRSKLYCKLQ